MSWAGLEDVPANANSTGLICSSDYDSYRINPVNGVYYRLNYPDAYLNSWFEARDACLAEGGNLARTYGIDGVFFYQQMFSHIIKWLWRTAVDGMDEGHQGNWTFWDGKYNGVLMPSTDYWFTVDYDEQNATKQFKAHFSLKR